MRFIVRARKIPKCNLHSIEWFSEADAETTCDSHCYSMFNISYAHYKTNHNESQTCMLFTESNKWPRLWFTLLNIGFRQDSGDNNGMVYQLFGAWIETKLLVWWKVVHSSQKPFYEWHLLGVGKLCVQATLRLDRGCWFCSHWFKLRYIVWWMMQYNESYNVMYVCNTMSVWWCQQIKVDSF